MRAISNDKVNNIYSLLRSKKSNSKVAKQVGVSRTTVQKYRSSLKMSRNVDEGGRPSLISQRMVNYIWRLVTLGRKNNAPKHHETPSVGQIAPTLDCGRLETSHILR
ncbi:hypothetical protein G6F55_012733 [Rhizopus delemar]|nr:hypothetical protein G6F55_012748 [Rhizopus delemar]KAG1443221.1 hypothetical protein G6F55_012733 [Rhizopus delemar]